MNEAKPFCISKWEVWEAYKRVKANKGAAGVDDRRRTYLHEKFDFLGYTFRARGSMTRKGKHFVSFSPAISAKAAQAIRTEVRSWKLPPTQ